MSAIELFHVGYAVRDIDTAMTHLATGGTTWRPVLDLPCLHLRTGTGDHEVDVRRVFSVEGPPFVELVEDTSGLWGGDGPGGVCHFGYWTDDLPADVAALEAQGFTRVLSDAGPDGGFERFAYLRSPEGLIFELVPSARKAQLLGEAS